MSCFSSNVCFFLFLNIISILPFFCFFKKATIDQNFQNGIWSWKTGNVSSSSLSDSLSSEATLAQSSTYNISSLLVNFEDKDKNKDHSSFVPLNPCNNEHHSPVNDKCLNFTNQRTTEPGKWANGSDIDKMNYYENLLLFLSTLARRMQSFPSPFFRFILYIDLVLGCFIVIRFLHRMISKLCRNYVVPVRVEPHETQNTNKDIHESIDTQDVEEVCSDTNEDIVQVPDNDQYEDLNQTTMNYSSETETENENENENESEDDKDNYVDKTKKRQSSHLPFTRLRAKQQKSVHVFHELKPRKSRRCS